MTIRVKQSGNAGFDDLMRRADREEEMASLALQDGDQKDAARRYALAREYRNEATEFL